MGWIRGVRTDSLVAWSPREFTSTNASKPGVEHVEHIEHADSSSRAGLDLAQQEEAKPNTKYLLQPETVADEALPFISAEEVVAKRRPGVIAAATTRPEDRRDCWLVVDDVVYDFTSFISSHPGGEQVIMSFIGEDCSWQFWRFHGEAEMAQYGKGLRIGRTKGVENRFKEPARFVGLSMLGDNDW